MDSRSYFYSSLLFCPPEHHIHSQLGQKWPFFLILTSLEPSISRYTACRVLSVTCTARFHPKCNVHKRKTSYDDANRCEWIRKFTIFHPSLTLINVKIHISRSIRPISILKTVLEIKKKQFTMSLF